jgi:hypothetical protein
VIDVLVQIFVGVCHQPRPIRGGCAGTLLGTRVGQGLRANFLDLRRHADIVAVVTVHVMGFVSRVGVTRCLVEGWAVCHHPWVVEREIALDSLGIDFGIGQHGVANFLLFDIAGAFPEMVVPGGDLTHHIFISVLRIIHNVIVEMKAFILEHHHLVICHVLVIESCVIQHRFTDTLVLKCVSYIYIDVYIIDVVPILALDIIHRGSVSVRGRVSMHTSRGVLHALGVAFPEIIGANGCAVSVGIFSVVLVVRNVSIVVDRRDLPA